MLISIGSSNSLAFFGEIGESEVVGDTSLDGKEVGVVELVVGDTGVEGTSGVEVTTVSTVRL